MKRDITIGNIKTGRYEMDGYSCHIYDKTSGKQIPSKSGKVYLLTNNDKLHVYSVRKIHDEVFPKNEHFSSYSLSTFVTRE